MKIIEQWYGDNQASALAELAKTAPLDYGYIIEIGVWQGASFSRIAQAVNPHTVLAVDTWRGNEDESAVLGGEHYSVTVARERDVYQEFLDNMRAENITNFQTYRMHWRDFLTCIYPHGTINGDKGIAFLHIDASHDYASVKANIEEALPFMIPGGIMCGDDYLTASDDRADLHGGVMRAVKETLPDHTNDHNLWIWRKG
jgi:Methyltransferase domain